MKRLLILSGKGGTGKTTTAAAFIRFAVPKRWLTAMWTPPISTWLPHSGQSRWYQTSWGEKRHRWIRRNVWAAACAWSGAAFRPFG